MKKNKKRKKKKIRKTDKYIIVKNFLLLVLILVCSAVIFIGVTVAGDEASYQLDGEKYERITEDDIKNSCFNIINMLK